MVPVENDMVTKDWVCKKCGMVMQKSVEKDYMLCCNYFDLCKSKLIPAITIDQLPRVYPVSTRCKSRYKIAGLPGVWEYVPYMHEKALDRPPAKGHVVCRKYNHTSSKWVARTLRQVRSQTPTRDE
jgi:hypothetical protein